MDQFSSGGNWTMIPTHNTNTPTHSQSQDPLYLHQQQQQQQFLHQTFQQPQQPQFQQQQLYQQQQQQQLLLQQQQQQQQQQQVQQQQQLQQQQQQQQSLHQSLASHYHLLDMVEKLAEVIEHGTPDQQSDALITELSTHFEKCQQLLNSISDSISTKAMTVEGQKKKLEESEQLLNQRRDLIANYRNSVKELVKSEP
ncbi:hypothetical protein PIB30_013465 [Stylosanthes scabra]|uniref:Mediator of RNA polymerase II transcription subunit 9 n=1 Tax=Stylosanthes scabra TaxID=79078 RepID=A0ABU6Z414_9FABA|nr:hypothetical protein [Stylosanthes scabra]